MNIKGVPENDTAKLAKKCYEMMKEMYKKEYSFSKLQLLLNNKQNKLI